MLKWRTRLKLNRISKVVIISCLAASVTFAGFTIYGTKVGNFVINVDETEGDLKITDDADPWSETAELTNILSTPALESQTNITYSNIPKDIAEGMGSKNGSNYFAYSFYLVNTDSMSTDYVFGTYLTEVTNYADEIIRFMVIKGEQYTYDFVSDPREYPADPLKSTGTIYAKAEASEGNKTYVEDMANYPSPQVDFYDEDTVCYVEDSIDGYSCVKYTLVMWIEGWDVECVDGHEGGTIKMEVNIVQA